LYWSAVLDSHRVRPGGDEAGDLGRGVANTPKGPGAATVAGAAGPATAAARLPGRTRTALLTRRRRLAREGRDGIGGRRLTGAVKQGPQATPAQSPRPPGHGLGRYAHAGAAARAPAPAGGSGLAAAAACPPAPAMGAPAMAAGGAAGAACRSTMVQECVSPAAVKGAASDLTSRHLAKCALNARLSLGGGSRPSFQSIKTLLILVLAFLSLHSLLSFTRPSRRHVSVPRPCRDI